MDVNVRAFRVVQAAISERSEPTTQQVSGRKGGLKGGRARAVSMSRERRVEIARKASAKRWSKARSNDE